VLCPGKSSSGEFGGGSFVISPAFFKVTEYEQVGEDGQLFTPPEQIRLRQFYQSGQMVLRDASRFAAALSYARGTYVSATPADRTDEPHREWWFAGALWNVHKVPPIICETVERANDQDVSH
jgi:hypothetical protein